MHNWSKVTNDNCESKIKMIWSFFDVLCTVIRVEMGNKRPRFYQKLSDNISAHQMKTYLIYSPFLFLSERNFKNKVIVVLVDVLIHEARSWLFLEKFQSLVCSLINILCLIFFFYFHYMSLKLWHESKQRVA